MSDAGYDHPAPKKKYGRLRMIIFGALLAFAFLMLFAGFMFVRESRKRMENLNAMAAAHDLQMAISAYQVDYHRPPLPSSVLSTADGNDIAMRSRGPMLPMLIGNVHVPQNTLRMNLKDVIYIRLPKAEDHKSGTRQEGGELVLVDPWGEPFYIVVDINHDNQIANPELSEDPSDPKNAAKGKANPEPKMLRMEVLVYSSGPDRDPKTWHDNICTWR